jgi:hypothetical protein
MSELGHIVGRPFKPGQSGNPSGLPGRPLGSRTVFSQGFLDDLAKTWRDKGRRTMEWTADKKLAAVDPHPTRHELAKMHKLREVTTKILYRRPNIAAA